MFTLFRRQRSTPNPVTPSRLPLLLITAGLLLLTAAAVHGQDEPAEWFHMVFDPATATSVRDLGVQDPGRLPGRSGDKGQTPGWTTIAYETAEGPLSGDWGILDLNPYNGFDFWGRESCRSFAGSSSIWSAGGGDQPPCTTYDAYQAAWLRLGPFSLEDAADARAEWRVWSQTNGADNGDDYLSWGASTNGIDYFLTPLDRDTNGWELQTFDFTSAHGLGDLRGDSSVWFAFVFLSTNDPEDITEEGTYLDEIVVEKLVDGGGGNGCDDLENGVVCLFDDRFEFTMTWTDLALITRPVPFQKFSHQSALGFYNNIRDIAVVVKVARGCGWNGHWWIWTGGASGKGAGWDLEVRDTVTGRTQTYSKPLGEFTYSAKDDSSFPCD